MPSLQQKAWISAYSALLFTLVNLPFTYGLTNRVLPTYDEATGCPTALGRVLHAVVFFLLSFLTMGNPNKQTGMKVKHALYGTLIFYLVSSPAVYSLVGSVLGSTFADPNGCPTLAGVLLHAVVYFLALLAVMYLP